MTSETYLDLTFSPPSSFLFLFFGYQTLPKGDFSAIGPLPVDPASAHYLHRGCGGGLQRTHKCTCTHTPSKRYPHGTVVAVGCEVLANPRESHAICLGNFRHLYKKGCLLHLDLNLCSTMLLNASWL